MTDNPAKFTPLKLSQLPSGVEGEGYPPDWRGVRSHVGCKRWFPSLEAAHPLSDGELLFSSKIESQERASNETLWAQATQPRFVFWLTFQPAEKKERPAPRQVDFSPFTCSSFAGRRPLQCSSGPRLAAFPRQRRRALLGVSGRRSAGARAAHAAAAGLSKEPAKGLK